MNKKNKITTALILALSVSLIEPSHADEDVHISNNVNLQDTSKQVGDNNTVEENLPKPESRNKNLTFEDNDVENYENDSTDVLEQSNASEENENADKSNSQNNTPVADKAPVTDKSVNEKEDTVDEDKANPQVNSNSDATKTPKQGEQIQEKEVDNRNTNETKENGQDAKDDQESQPLEISEITNKEPLKSPNQIIQGPYVLTNDQNDEVVAYDNFNDLRDALLNQRSHRKNTLTLYKDLEITEDDIPNDKYFQDYLLSVGRDHTPIDLTIKSDSDVKRKISFKGK